MVYTNKVRKSGLNLVVNNEDPFRVKYANIEFDIRIWLDYKASPCAGKSQSLGLDLQRTIRLPLQTPFEVDNSIDSENDSTKAIAFPWYSAFE